MEFKELFDLPPLGALVDQGLDLRAQDGAQESLILEVLGLDAATLDQFTVKSLGMVLEVVRLGGGGVTWPARGKAGLGNLAPALRTLRISRQGTEQIEVSLLAHGLEKLLAIGVFQANGLVTMQTGGLVDGMRRRRRKAKPLRVWMTKKAIA